MRPELTIIIPCFNESQTAGDVIRRVVDLPIEKQIIVVDDGSTDGTVEIIKQLREDFPEIETIFHDRNRGKGAAVRTAFAFAKGKFTIVQDADQEYDPMDIIVLLNVIRNEENTIVYGARQLGNPANHRRILDLGVAAINRIASAIHGVKLQDIMTCYKLIPTEVLLAMDLQCNGFEFCTEITAKASRMHLRILEVPISYRPRTKDAGKKARISHGPSVVYALWKYRKWTPRSRDFDSMHA